MMRTITFFFYGWQSQEQNDSQISRKQLTITKKSLGHAPVHPRFKPPVATKFMQQILQTHLQHKVYHAEESQKLPKLIAEEIKTKLIG